MDGPRSLRPEEVPSLEKLVDTVFSRGESGRMAYWFPWFFHASNANNLLIFADGDKIVSHVGMTLHWASLAGCTIGVACVGGVATYEEYRGQSLASRLMTFACQRATDWGADIMLISGGRGLYRRMGAADVGREWAASIDAPIAASMADASYQLSQYQDSDLPACVSAYRSKTTHFIRRRDDWLAYLKSRTCKCREIDFHIIRKQNVPVAYLVTPKENADDGSLKIIECAGDATAITAACHLLIEHYGARAVRLQLQRDEHMLRALLEQAGVSLTLTVFDGGTLLLLNTPRLIRRLRPFFETVTGRETAETFDISEEDNHFVITAGVGAFHTEHIVDDRATLAEYLFGHPERHAPEGILQSLLPIPTLEYGLNYI